MRLGFHKIEISPTEEVSLIGYDFRQKVFTAGNSGIHDPLFLRAITFETEQTTGCILNYDLAIIETPLARKLRSIAAEELKILGLVIRKDLSWKSNTKQMTNKAYGRLWMIRRLKLNGANLTDLL